MKRMRNRKPVILPVLLAALFLTACGGSEPATETVSSTENQIHGMIIDAGEVSALCPDGWNSVGVPDLTAENPETMETDALRFVKGGSTQDDVLTNAFVEMHFYKSEKDVPETEPQKLYDNVTDTGEINTGKHSWSGYSGSSLGKPFVFLQTSGDSGVFTAVLYTQEGSANAAAINDADVQAILNSIEISGK